jgi:hypothetical protein
VWAGVDLGVPLTRGEFGSDGLGLVFKVGAVSLRAGLGLELRFF